MKRMFAAVAIGDQCKTAFDYVFSPATGKVEIVLEDTRGENRI
jgi:hypothetical protein